MSIYDRNMSAKWLVIAMLFMPSLAHASEGPAWMYVLAYFMAFVLEALPYFGVGVGILCILLFVVRKNRGFIVVGCVLLLAGAGAALIQKAAIRRGDREAEREQRRNAENPQIAALNLAASQDLAKMKAQLEAMHNGLPQTAADATQIPDVDPSCIQWQEGIKANELVAKARARHPDYARMSPEALHTMGLDHDKRKEYADAIVAWEWEVEKNPRSLDGINDIGYAYQRLNNPEMALTYARKATAINPRFGHGHYTAGRALLIMGRYTSAQRELQAAIRDGWKEWESQKLLGLTLRAIGDEVGAEVALHRSMALRPDDQETQKYLAGERYMPNWPACREQIAAQARALKDLVAGDSKSPKPGSPVQADAQHLQQLKKRLPKHLVGQTPKSMHTAAMELFKARQDVAAAATWLVGADGTEELREKARYKTWAARAITRAGDITNGAALAMEADQMAPTEPEVAYGAAIVAYQSGRYHDALARIELAEKNGLTSDSSLFLHGIVLQILGRPGDARQTFHRMKKDPTKGGQFIGRVEKPDIWGGPL